MIVRVLSRWILVLALVPSIVIAADSSPIAIDPDGTVAWAVNPDSNTVSALDTTTHALLGEYDVGRYPRTVAVTTAGVYVANQGDDTVTRLMRDGTFVRSTSLPFGCGPYGVAASPGSERIYVTCQSTSEVHVFDAALAPLTSIRLSWPEARAMAVAADGRVFVTHFITKEPNHAGHVSEIDPSLGDVTRVLEIPPDFATCETFGSGQGVANLLGAASVVPTGAPGGVGGQLWVGGTLHNALRKGLFHRSRFFQGLPGTGLFPVLDFQSNPPGEGDAARRNLYRAGLHDLARSAVWKIDLDTGAVVARLDVVGGGQVAGIAFSPDGAAAHVVDTMANGYYTFATTRGEPGNAAALFGPVSAFGPGGADPSTPCTGAADAVVAEAPFVRAPQARLVPTGGMEPLDAVTLTPVDTGLEFTVATGLMRGVTDGVGTTPIGVAVSENGGRAFVANYLARNVAVLDTTPAGLRCQAAPAGASCTSANDCAPGDECMPLVAAVVATTDRDPVPPEILDGKILFSTAARDAAGAGGPVPPWNHLTRDGTTVQGEVTSTARDGGSLACTSCHPDFGGQDGRTWDFAQFGSSLRNTMDLRGRAAFAPGTCDVAPAVSCTTDAECGPFLSGARCLNDPNFIPPNIAPASRDRFFNPMGAVHWNGDRDEVEDFEFTFRELLGASDCDGAEDKPETCVGALVIRRFTTDPAPVDVRVDLSPVPNRTLTARLDHLGDFVYSLTEFPRNPNLGFAGQMPSAAAARGRAIFNDSVVDCAFCHNGPAPARQQFTNKGPNPGYDATQVPRADLNSPFLRFSVGTANVFDATNPFFIASDGSDLLGFTLFQNEQTQVPGNRTTLDQYITPPLNDVWNTAPFLHDGSAPTLLDVVRPCSPLLDDCTVAGRGRNVNDLHGVTSMLSARQLNDLAAFQEAPHGPIAGTPNLANGPLVVQKLKIRFGKKPGTDRLILKASGTIPDAGAFAPLIEPVTLGIGRPDGQRMAILDRTVAPESFTVRRSTHRYKDRTGTALGGLRQLVLKTKGREVSLRATLKGTDLGILRTAAPNFTIAVEVGSQTMAGTRGYETKRQGTVIVGPPKRRRS